MISINKKTEAHLERLIKRYPELNSTRNDILKAFLIMETTYEHGGKVLIAGNGGSAADSEHFAGELMKRFIIPRPIKNEFAAKLASIDKIRGEKLSQQLERGLTAIPLVAHESLSTAFINDVGGDGLFAQQLLGFGRPGDAFLAISTSGNSENILSAAVVAKSLDINTIGLTGSTGGTLASFSDVCVKVPADETYMIQEYHLPVYHCWAMMLEEHFFKKN